MELDHEDRSHAWDRPPHSDVGPAVHLAHDPLQHAGAELRSPLVSEEEPAGAGVGEEGEHLGLRCAQVAGRGSGAAGTGVVDEVALGIQSYAVVVAGRQR